MANWFRIFSTEKQAAVLFLPNNSQSLVARLTHEIKREEEEGFCFVFIPTFDGAAGKMYFSRFRTANVFFQSKRRRNLLLRFPRNTFKEARYERGVVSELDICAASLAISQFQIYIINIAVLCVI